MIDLISGKSKLSDDGIRVGRKRSSALRELEDQSV